MMLGTHKNPRLFQFYGSSAKWVLVSNCKNLALKENRKHNNASTVRQSYLHNPLPLCHSSFYTKMKSSLPEFDFIKIGIWNWYCITLNNHNHISYKNNEISTCSLTSQTHRKISTKKSWRENKTKKLKKLRWWGGVGGQDVTGWPANSKFIPPRKCWNNYKYNCTFLTIPTSINQLQTHTHTYTHK